MNHASVNCEAGSETRGAGERISSLSSSGSELLFRDEEVMSVQDPRVRSLSYEGYVRLVVEGESD